jgi:riboflavin-specific deaminase-like protein
MPERLFDLTLPEAPCGPVVLGAIYDDLRLPEPPAERPYVLVNMVATVDGKTVIGESGTTWLIGSDTDHALMERLNNRADAVLIGAGIVREDNPGYPPLTPELRAERAARGVRPEPWWIIVTSRAQFSGTPRLLEETPERVAICTTRLVPPERLQELQTRARVLIVGDESIDARTMLRALRQELGIRSLCCLGGATLNGTLFDAGCVDELFLTIAPKLKGSSGTRTVVEGKGFPARHLLPLDLISLYREGSELYLRYRVRW